MRRNVLADERPDELEQPSRRGPDGTLSLDSEDGRTAIVPGRVVVPQAVRPRLRRVGFGHVGAGAASVAAVALEVGIVGLPNAGKTTLFNALTRAGAEITAYASVSEKPNVGMAAIADERLGRLAALVGARKVTPAAVRVVDVPGTGPALLGNLRQVDALLAVTDGFSDGPIPARIWRRSSSSCSSPTATTSSGGSSGSEAGEVGRAAMRQEAELLERVLAHLDAGDAARRMDGRPSGELEPLTTKPLLAIENGPGGIDCKLEAELADLPDEEAAAFRDGTVGARGGRAPAQEALGLITFFTAGEKETRAWTLRDGPDGARGGRRRSTPTSREGSSAAR